MQENDNGLEPLAVFIGHGGQMLGPSSWYRIRCDARRRMQAHANEPEVPVIPRSALEVARHSAHLRIATAVLPRTADGR